MGILTDEPHPDFEPLINDEELDGFWDNWGWTNQLFFIACEHEDDDRIVRARSATDAVAIFHTEDTPHHNGRKVAYVYRIPTNFGLTGILDWRSPELPAVQWQDPNILRKRGKK